MPCNVNTALDVSMPMRLYWVMDGSGLGCLQPQFWHAMPWGRPPQQLRSYRELCWRETRRKNASNADARGWTELSVCICVYLWLKFLLAFTWPSSYRNSRSARDEKGIGTGRVEER